RLHGRGQGRDPQGRRPARRTADRLRPRQADADQADHDLQRLMTDILRRIETYKREEIAAAKTMRPWQEVVAQAHDAAPVRRFVSAIRKKKDAGQTALIAEVKKA